MALRFAVAMTVICVCICVSTPAQVAAKSGTDEVSKTVFPISELRFVGVELQAEFGTGFCVDLACRFIGTNYHVAMLGRPRRIKGEKVVQRYLATGPDDEDATVQYVPGLGRMKYAVSRDLAIFELRRPLSNHRGVSFDSDELRAGQPVTIYSYPKDSIKPIRNLVACHAAFIAKDTDGLLTFQYSPNEKKIRPGASGGIVLDDATGNIVGVLSAIATEAESVALAVPIDSLSDFVHKIEPYLAQRLFPSGKTISPLTADLYPKFVPRVVDGLQHRPEESPAVKRLRRSAQSLTDGMRDFVATQTFEWGAGNGEPSAFAIYEIRVVDGVQKFRELPNGRKEYEEVPFPPLNTTVSAGPEWFELARMVGTELDLKIHEAPDAVVGEKRIRVFQYAGAREDRVCPWHVVLEFGFFKINRHLMPSCFGEVWTDDEMNIIRMSLHLEGASGGWDNPETQVTYGWLRRKNEAPRLTPLTIAVQAESHKKLYWCRGQFTNYRTFESRVKIGTESAPVAAVIP